jgi:DNA-binding XRE family transcriptional regulator
MVTMSSHRPSLSLEQLRDDLWDIPSFREGYEGRDAIVKLGRAIRDLRLQAGLSVAQLAQAANVADTDVTALEDGVIARTDLDGLLTALSHQTVVKLPVLRSNLPTVLRKGAPDTAA